NAAQCGQDIEAYSVMDTGAFAGPSAISGSDIGFATSAAVAVCAMASPIGCSGAKATRAASPASDRAAAKARRGTIKGKLRNRRCCTLEWKSLANLKRQIWQWQWRPRRLGGPVAGG